MVNGEPSVYGYMSTQYFSSLKTGDSENVYYRRVGPQHIMKIQSKLPNPQRASNSTSASASCIYLLGFQHHFYPVQCMLNVSYY